MIAVWCQSSTGSSQTVGWGRPWLASYHFSSGKQKESHTKVARSPVPWGLMVRMFSQGITKLHGRLCWAWKRGGSFTWLHPDEWDFPTFRTLRLRSLKIMQDERLLLSFSQSEVCSSTFPVQGSHHHWVSASASSIPPFWFSQHRSCDSAPIQENNPKSCSAWSRPSLTRELIEEEDPDQAVGSIALLLGVWLKSFLISDSHPIPFPVWH